MTMTMTSSKGANRQPGYLDAKRVGKDDEMISDINTRIDYIVNREPGARRLPTVREDEEGDVYRAPPPMRGSRGKCEPTELA